MCGLLESDGTVFINPAIYIYINVVKHRRLKTHKIVIHTYINTYIHTYIHTCIHTYTLLSIPKKTLKRAFQHQYKNKIIK